MRAFLYGFREYDEGIFFDDLAKEMGIEYESTADLVTMENSHLAAGCEVIGVTPSPIEAPLLDRFKEMGVKMICTRCVGYNHIDIEHAKKIGMIITHVEYDPDGVAEFAIMGMLVMLRRVKEAVVRMWSGDFRYAGLQSRELRDMTIGIIGAGRIGTAVLKCLTGFGCKLYYTDRRRKEEADKYAEYIGFDDLLRKCDIVSIHLALNEDTFHIMDTEAFAKMKEKSIFVNTARGGLVDTEALISALNSGPLEGAMLDTVEDEVNYYNTDCREVDLSEHYIGRLKAMTNVLFTHHIAFYSENVIREIAYHSLEIMKAYAEGKEIPYRVA